ncbi:hypothetical protein EXIGLDRAFT_840702 [Exidia glandulosa HHB12029]|uniref:Uncharacterized protein n=1 Tax=Exidia glandulosa HHB12029 TaxID=1314781 RepID=A0A165EB61_EXIGL|nr:hypothetical protein EXIGLDRAFT_840702 [Exidia glandulosa HHB12029]
MPLAHDWLHRVENVRRECDTSSLSILADAAHPAKGKESMYLPVATGQGAHPRIVAGRNPTGTGNKTNNPVVLVDKSNMETCRKEYKLLADDAVADVQETEPADRTATAKILPAHTSLAQAQVLGKRRRDDQDVDGTEEAWEDQSTQSHGQDTANAGSSQVASGALPKIFIRIPPRAVPVSRRARLPPARQSLQRSCKKRRVD